MRIPKYGCHLRYSVAHLALLICSTLSASAQTFTLLHTFHGPPDGNSPRAALTLDDAGDLYGTTTWGGISFHGIAFKLSPGEKEKVLYNFDAVHGVEPYSPLVRDDRGTLYGTTLDGGASDGGTVFALDQNGRERVLHSFGKINHGYGVNGVIRDPEGNLYGTTVTGGITGCASNGCGLVFKLAPSGKMTVLYEFTGGSDGGVPFSSLIRDSDGTLYGTTWWGGDPSCNPPYGCGTVFKLNSGGETVLYTFTNNDGDGAFPNGVVRGAEGNFYGTTAFGGGSSNCSFGCGTVFELDPSGTETVLYSFAGAGGDGGYPNPIIRDSNGNIYGTTQYGGTALCYCGIVFMLSPSGTETILHSFTGSDGEDPTGLVRDNAGNLYGATAFGGDPSCNRQQGCGTLFKVRP